MNSQSTVADLKMSQMHIKIIPALSDNYMYLIIDLTTREAAIVDPVHPESVMSIAFQECVHLRKVLTTHHHWDHASGNVKLMNMAKNQLEVYGSDERIGALTHKVMDNYSFNIGQLKVRCIYTPCHTSGDICYYVEAPNGERAVFTGDTLFQGGCGRFFEGNAQQMYIALCQKLASLPDDTKVFCGHEYTLPNLSFASHVEPNNEFVLKRIEWARGRRASFAPTVPSTIGEEKLWNPFMRVHEYSVQSHVGTTDPIACMHSLRKEKDTFTC